MTHVVPVALEDAVYAAARSVVGDAPLAAAALAAAVRDRSRRYTTARDELAQPADRTADLAARAAFFTICDAMKIAVPIGELVGRGALPAREPLRVVDLGAGCGAMTLGLAAALPARALAIDAIDRDADALRVATAAVRAFAGARATLTTRVADATRIALEAASAELVVVGTMLNELPPAARLPLIARALAALVDDGALIVVEPALRDCARALHEVRDAALAAGLGHVFAPCTRAGAPCPALADPRDWCHEARALELPPRTAELARTTHLRDDGMKFAYLVLRRAPLPLVAEAGRAWRIVDEPRAAKGKLEVLGCSDAGRVPLRLLRRHRDAGNRELERARRGDVVVVDGAEPPAARVEVTAASRVTRVIPSSE